MWLRAFLIVGLNLLFNSDSNLHCSCDYGGSFLNVTSQSDIVAIVKVKRHLSSSKIYEMLTPMSMEVEVTEVLSGKEYRKKIRIWGDNGYLCRPYLTRFKTGSTWVMGLNQGNPKWGHDDETEDDYSISTCGEYFMRIKNDSVEGLIRGEKPFIENEKGERVSTAEKMSLDEFRKLFNESRK